MAGGERGETGSESSVERPIPAGTTDRANYWLREPEKIVGGGPKARFERNKRALETYEQVTLEGRDPNPDELDTIAGYMGWGSFGQELFQGTWDRPVAAAGWQKENEWLREHLGKQAWESVRDSIINAHYTDPPTVNAMWGMVKAMGFQGGRVLEPSIGIGNFFGLMPREMMAKSQLTGIELDRVVAAMAKMLYPQANIQQKGYQESETGDNFYDLVIGNWPFASEGPSDRRYNRFNLSLHDYFFVKALDQVRPGGIVIGITSSGTMDKKGVLARQQMARRAELLAAFRLPTGAFEKYAGTKVVTDILVLRKRDAVLDDLSGEKWMQTGEIGTRNGQPITVNQYWQEHPDHVLGELNHGHGTTFGKAGMIVDRPENFAELLAALSSRVPTDAFRPWAAKAGNVKFIANSEKLKQRQNSVVWVDREGEKGLFVVKGEQLAHLDDLVRWKVKNEKENERRAAEIRDLADIAAKLDALFDAQRRGEEDTDSPRKALRGAYQRFVAEHGPLHESKMLRVMTQVGDPRIRSVLNLERRERDGRIVPAAIMERDITRKRSADAHGSIEDAYVISRNDTLNLDLDKIAALSGYAREQVIKNLVASNQIFMRPDGVWEYREDYLSGNVRQKLREAEDAKAQGLDMDRNIRELTAILPKDVPYNSIEVQMGASWVSTPDYRDFLAHLLETDPANAAKDFSLAKGASGWNFRLENKRLGDSAQATTKWGVGALPFRKIFEAAMNGTSVTVWYEDDKGAKHIDTAATQEANLKVDNIREEFVSWIWKDPERTGRLSREYNEALNSEVTPSRDGSHLRFEGLALTYGKNEFDYRQHQKDAVWRGLQDGRMVAFHEVGTGKTFTIAGLAVEGRRLGAFRKPILFAHNANAESVAKDMNVAYPGAKVLFVDNLQPETRDNTLRQIALDEWDLVVIPHSLIDRFTLRKETLMGIAEQQIRELEEEIYAAAQDADADLTGVDLSDEEAVRKALARKKGAHTAKELVKARNRIIKRIEEKAAEGARPDAMFFEDMGIDTVMVDEAHIFKKVGLATRKQIKGLSKDESERAWALSMMTDYVKRQNAGKGVFLFTGTPLTNNLNEAYNMMRYVMDDVMDRASVKRFDDWFNAFAATTTDIELTTGGTHQAVTRLLSFVNVPELARMAARFFDVVLAKHMPEFKPRASDEGMTEDPQGRPAKQTRIVISEMSERQRAHKKQVEQRYKDYQNLAPKDKRIANLTGGDTPIRMEDEGSKSALDFRLLRPEAEDHDEAKINKMAATAAVHYAEHPLSTQMIFLERGFNDFVDRETTVRDAEGMPVRNLETGKTVKQKERVRAFNLVRDMVEKMEAKGIPAESVAVFSNMALDPMADRPNDVLRRVIRPGQRNADIRPDGKPITKEDIAAAMREGKVRIAIGSTQTMGTGVNAQTYMRAMHHLDAPWTPGEFEQRNGRGWRQGNKWNTVYEYRYFTEGSHDGRRWQILLNKVRFIARFTDMLLNAQTGKGIRVLSGEGANLNEGGADVADFEQSFSSAAGDPRLLLRSKLSSEIGKLERRRSAHLASMEEARRRVRMQTEEIARKQKHLAEHLRPDLERLQAGMKQGFSITIGKRTFTDRGEAEKALAELPSLERTQTVGEFMGFKIRYLLNENTKHLDYGLRFRLEGAQEYLLGSFSLPSMTGTLRQIPRMIADAESRIKNLERERESLREVEGQPFSREQELEDKRKALAQIEAEISRAPVPAPSWLRNGAPQGSLVYLKDGKAYEVEAHRWDDNGYWLLVNDDGAIRPIEYREARDEAGTPIFEPVPFKTPSGVEKPAMSGTEESTSSAEPLPGWLLAAPKTIGGRESKLARMKRLLDEQEKFAEEADSLERYAPDFVNRYRPELEAALKREIAKIEQQKYEEVRRGIVRPLSAPPENQDLRESLVSAVRALPPKEREVLNFMLKSGATIEEAAKAANLTPQAAKNAYEVARAKLRRVREAVAGVGAIFRKALAEPPGRRTIGRPELANPATGEQSRVLVDAIDQIRKENDIPMRKADEDTQEEADQQWKKLGASGVRKALFERARGGGQLTDAETINAKRIVRNEALKAVRQKDEKTMVEAAILIDAYRQTGTEQARAFRARRDAVKTPSQRFAEYLGEALLTPDRKRKKALDQAQKDGDLKKREAILRDWAKQIEKLKEKLKKLGLDLDNLDEDGVRAFAKDRVKAEKAVRAVATAKADAWDALYEYWVSAILSAPSTNVANISGNFANGAWDFLPQRLAEAVVNLFVRDPKSAQFGEFAAVLRGMGAGLSRASRNMVAAWRTETPIFEQEVLGQPGSTKVEERRHAISGTKGRIIRTPLRLLGAADDFAKSLFGTMQVQAEAYRMAKAEGLTGDALAARIGQLTMTPMEAVSAYRPRVTDDAAVEARAKQLADGNAARLADRASDEWEQARNEAAMKLAEEAGYTDEAWRSAVGKATELAFQEELGPAGKLMLVGKAKIPGFRYIVPFVTTLSNILKVGVRKSPLGSPALLYRLLRQGFVSLGWDGSGWHYTRTQFVTHAAEQLIAFGILMALRSLAAPGDDDLPFITGTTPYEPGKRGPNDLANRAAPQQSIRIGGRWYSYARIEPFATALSFTVDLLNRTHAAATGQDATAAIGSAYQHIVSQLKDKTFARGLSDVLNAVQDGESAVQWAGNFATSWVPNVVRATARESDDTVREQRVWGNGDEWGQMFAQRLGYKAFPVAANAPEPKVDLWGRDIKKDGGPVPGSDVLWRLFSPARTQEANVHPLDRLLLNWGNQHPNEIFAPAPPSPYWTTTQDGKRKTVAMSPREYHDFLRMAGRMAASQLAADPLNYEQPTAEDIKTIARTIAGARKETRRLIWLRRTSANSASSLLPAGA